MLGFFDWFSSKVGWSESRRFKPPSFKGGFLSCLWLHLPVFLLAAIPPNHLSELTVAFQSFLCLFRNCLLFICLVTSSCRNRKAETCQHNWLTLENQGHLHLNTKTITSVVCYVKLRDQAQTQLRKFSLLLSVLGLCSQLTLCWLSFFSISLSI